MGEINRWNNESPKFSALLPKEKLSTTVESIIGAEREWKWETVKEWKMAIPMPCRQLFIDGEWREPVKKKRIPIINPSTEQIIGTPSFFLLFTYEYRQQSRSFDHLFLPIRLQLLISFFFCFLINPFLSTYFWLRRNLSKEILVSYFLFVICVVTLFTQSVLLKFK